MNENRDLPLGGFIHVFNILRLLYNGKWFIILTALVGLLLGIYNLKNATFTHDITLKLVPVENNASQSSGSSGLLSGLLTLGNIGGSSTNNFQSFLNVLESRMISHELSKDEEFMKTLFRGQYNENLNKWKTPKPSSQLKFRNFIKNVLGMPIYEMNKPNSDSLYTFLTEEVDTIFIEDKSMIILKISMEKKDIDLGKMILNKIAIAGDNIIKKRNNDRVEQHIDFLMEKIEKTQQVDLRTAIINTLSKQYSKQMSGSSDLPFAAEMFGEVYATPKHTHPRGLVVLGLNIFFGFIAGCLIIILNSIRKNIV